MHRAARTKGDSTRKLIRASAATGLNKSSAAKVGTVVWTEQELKLLGAAVFTKVKEMEAENAKLKAQLQAYQKRDAQAAAEAAATAALLKEAVRREDLRVRPRSLPTAPRHPCAHRSPGSRPVLRRMSYTRRR